MYRIRDTHTQQWASGPYVSRKRARARAEVLNLEYGAHRYRAIPVDREEK